MNVRCPNCGAVFPVTDGRVGEAECPLCLHQFVSAESETRSVSVEDSGSSPAAPSLAGAAPTGEGGPRDLGQVDPFGGPEAFPGTPTAVGTGLTGAGAAETSSGEIDFDALLSGGGAGDALGAGPEGSGMFSGAPPASDVFTSEANPFGAPEGSDSNPFAASPGGSDPFAASPGGSDPFAASPGGSDPFAASSGGSDPFAASPGGDPFAASSGGDPFAASSGGDPFAASSGGDPFAASPGGTDPFASDGGDPFAPGQEETVVLPGGSGAAPAADTSLFGDDDGDSLFLATPSTSGAIFDEEEEEDDSSPSFAGIGAPQMVAPAAVPAAALPAKAKEKKSGLASSLGPLLVVVVAIVGLDFAGVVDFGIARALMPGARKEEARKKQEQLARSLVTPVALRDSLKTYLAEIDRLHRVTRLSPQDQNLHRQLADRLLDVYERFPGIFDSRPEYRKMLEALQNKVGIPPRYALLQDLANVRLDGLEDKLRGHLQSDHLGADDYGVGVLGMMDLFRRHRRDYLLAHPGEMADASRDPMAVTQPDDKYLARARPWMDKALELSAKAPNRLKFVYHDARLRTMMGDWEALIEEVEPAVREYPEHNRFRLLLAGGYVAGNRLGKAAALLAEAHDTAIESDRKGDLVITYRIEARLEARRGRFEDEIKALQGVVKLRPADELTVIRLAKLQLRQKHAREAQALLIAGKKRGFRSIAFEVALVDFWLWAHRTEDALLEIKVATKLYPDTVELLYLRGQIEDRKQHSATARDYFSQVIAKRPQHLKAQLRLAQLQARAGRHDDALITLTNARKRLGDLASILEPMADEYLVLKRPVEARAIYGELLKRQPSNKEYLVHAARIDMVSGKVDRALRYMRQLRADGNLDQTGALQMARALVLKGRHAEAAKTIVPFAERDQNNVRINVLAGKALLDSGQLELANTFLTRAYQVAQRQGGDAESLFQYGRLAFKKGDVKQGIARLQQAIKLDPSKPYYRYFLGFTLFDLFDKGSEEVGLGPIAEKEMKYLILHADRFAGEGTPLTFLHDVHRRLGLYYMAEKRFDRAIAHLRTSVRLHGADLEARIQLGAALYLVNHPDAESVLRQVIQRSPGEPRASLYLGLLAQQHGHTTAAIKWLRVAAASGLRDVAESMYQLGTIYRERRAFGQARKWFKAFLARAPKHHAYYKEAQRALQDIKSS